ncbi:MAG TPA: hypothetical protein VE620_08330, partial [Myxococcales bacterium]|nr:hypothetical protein [Myxococcales bacterium]
VRCPVSLHVEAGGASAQPERTPGFPRDARARSRASRKLAATLALSDNDAVEQRSIPQDFFFDLMRDSQRARAAHLAERERWIRTLEISGREEVLFELEMLLRGIDCFFNLRNLFGDAQPEVDRDFREELKAARDATHRAAHLARRLIVQKQEQALLFRSFVEATLADDRARAHLGTELREQRTPEESLFLLRSGLSAHQGIIDHLLRVESTPQQVFVDVGRALRHELFVSRYFCPPAPLEFRGEYDRVNSVKALEALQKSTDEKKRRALALALLAAFRSLRALRYVPAPPVPHTRRVLVVLALVRSELSALIGYLETELPRRVATVAGVGSAASVGRAAAASLRSALQRIPPLLAEPISDRSQIDEHRDQLAAAAKDAIGAIASALDPKLSRKVLFESGEERVEASQRLRFDLSLFRELCRAAAERLGSAADASVIQPVRRFSMEFRDVGYQLLRHSDRELFDRFLDLVQAWGAGSPESAPERLGRLRDDCRRFGDVLDRALENVGKRAELKDYPLDERRVGEALARRLAAV